MTIEEALKRAAHGIAAEVQSHVSQLEQEALELKERQTQKEAERDSASRSFERLLNLPVKLGADYTCPRCWIIHSKQSSMRPIQSATASDIFECRDCGFELLVQPFC
jgi:predicted RNA-binding Zn-ribbon protein involved in translation (DUF1610 family)